MNDSHLSPTPLDLAVKATANKLAKACFYIMRDKATYDAKMLFSWIRLGQWASLGSGKTTGLIAATAPSFYNRLTETPKQWTTKGLDIR